ncbi:uncharacterized protein BT62DRAFT_930717 [Guyanagaster necrorhizus]|uniref:RGS domain-containing protein n=1 Tax=Guyanagaster necrorhizus TaxID=856835 RepID=A0A9P7VVM6_9AGAR|nr:uncharacterized protein BT62DRAFT_930717 [Guyanagaster necrorhizus MCA 3950]KAG7447692.1 hypothetical protein BT62DRAFT_930717 [Guyanagaster necrorhizus MCA 3950]
MHRTSSYGKPSEESYVAKLHPWAEKLNTRRLAGITLAQVLLGGTCSPISFEDFEFFLAFREHSLANLQFVVWYQDYRKRFSELHDRQSLKRRDESISSITSCSSLASNISHSKHDIPSGPYVPIPSNDPDNPLPIPPPISLPPVLSSSSPAINDRALREECMNVISTFLAPDAPKALKLDAGLRDDVVRRLATNCDPDVFKPAYEAVYFYLDRVSLPRFLAYATPNINLPKQIFFYILGILYIVAAIIITITLILFVPVPPQSNRAWRLLASVPLALGTYTVCAAWRGFCAQLWHRQSVQLHSWELQAANAKSLAYVNSVRGRGLGDMRRCVGLVCNSADGTYGRGSPPVCIFQSEEPPIESKPRGGGDTPITFGVTRPPVFGPEKVVKDARILAVHRQVMQSCGMVGLWALLIFSAVILPIPGRQE